MESDRITPEECPLCGAALCGRSGPHGLLFVCEACCAGATTLSVLKRAAPRGFVNHLWQAARRDGTLSAKRCPSCTQPLIELVPPAIEIEPRVDVCIRCYLVWLEKPALRSLDMTVGRAPAPARLQERLHARE